MLGNAVTSSNKNVVIVRLKYILFQNSTYGMHIKNTHLSLCVRKATICMGENTDADQLRESDQRLCFRYTDSTFPPLLIPKLSRF